MSKKYLKKRGLDPEDVFKRTGQKLRWGHGSRKDLQRLERKARKDMKKRDDSSSGSSNSDEEKTQPKDEGRNKVSRSQSPAPRPRQAPAPTNPPKTQEPTIYSRIWNENMQSEKKKAKSRTQEPMEKEEYERPVKSKNCDVSPKLPGLLPFLLFDKDSIKIANQLLLLFSLPQDVWAQLFPQYAYFLDCAIEFASQTDPYSF